MTVLALVAGSLNTWALESYDFQELCMALGKGGPWAVNDGGDAGFTIGDATMHYLGDYTEQGFIWNQRFAYEYVEVDGTPRGKFTMRNKSNKKDQNCGMFSWDYTHYFSILNLKDGDKVTITILTGSATHVSANVTNEVVEGDAVTSEYAYTIETDQESTRFDIQMASATLISKISIEPYGVETVPAISVSPKTLKLIPGATSKLSVSIDPAGMETQWTSSDKSVATVAADGTVKAIAPGPATITNSWQSTVSDATSADACVVTVTDIDLSQYQLVADYDFLAMGDVTLELQAEAAGAIWNQANSKNNDVFFCTNEGLENIAVQAAVSNNKGWSIVVDQGLFMASGAGRCAAVGGIKQGQIVEFLYTGDHFYTRSDDDGIEKTALNEGTGRAIYQADEDGMIGFELDKGNAVTAINVYELPVVDNSYKFVASEWPAGDPGRISADKVVVDEEANTITVSQTGQNNVALKFVTANEYTVAPELRYFTIRATGLSTTDGDSYLWWLNNANHGTQVKPTDIYEDNGVTVFAWDIRTCGLGDNFSATDITTLQNTGDWITTFGMTLADATVPAVISYIGFEESVAEPITEFEYEFVASEWPAGDPGRISASNVVIDEEANTIRVDALGDNNVALNFKTDKVYYVTKPVKYFVIQATGLSTEAGKSYLWWLNAKNNGAQMEPTKILTGEDGLTTFAWDINENSAFASGFNAEGMSYLDGTGASTWGWTTTFGMTLADSNEPAIFYYIGYEPEDSDIVTGIDANTVHNQNNSQAIYNLAGQQIKQATKGLFIINGKKVVMK